MRLRRTRSPGTGISFAQVKKYIKHKSGVEMRTEL